MTWNGLTAGGHKRAAAVATQDAFDAREAKAREQNRQIEIDYNAAANVTPHADSATARFDGGSFAPGACKCQWRRDGRLGLAKRADGSVIETQVCPTCNLSLYG